MENPIINRVANSSLILFDLSQFRDSHPRLVFDLKPFLYQEMILKESAFREQIKLHNWNQYQNTNVAITCSVETIVPLWAYMLVATKLHPYVNTQVFGTLVDLEFLLYQKVLHQIEWKNYENKRVVIKGCSKEEVPVALYIEVVNRLMPLASSIMFGEPCSTVPLFKKATLT